MPRERISDETKRRIIKAHENQRDYMEVARVLGVKRGTAWSIVSRFFGKWCRGKTKRRTPYYEN